MEHNTKHTVYEPFTLENPEQALADLKGEGVPADAKVRPTGFPDGGGFAVQAFWDTAK